MSKRRTRRRRSARQHRSTVEPVHVTRPDGLHNLEQISPLDRLGIDSNGRLTRSTLLDGHPVVIHYDDIPESDITTVDGMRVTTPLRTAIDLATQLSTDELNDLVDNCIGRGLFSADEAFARLDQPDLASHPGGPVLRDLLLRRERG